MNGASQSKPAPNNSLAPTNRCILVFARHMGEESDPKPSPFTAEKLRPLAEDAIKTDSRIHLIHERIPSFPMTSLIVNRFEDVLKNKRAIRQLRGEFEAQRLSAIRQFLRADLGKESDEINREDPMCAVLLKFNRLRPGTIISHVNSYSFEAIVEYSRAYVHMARGRIALKASGLRGVIEEVVKSNKATVRSMLSRDKDLARQTLEMMRSCPGEAFFIPRGSTHEYMVRLFEEMNIFPEVEIEPIVPGFSDEAMKTLLNGADLARTEHERLALLDVLFQSDLARRGNPADSESRQAAREEALELYPYLKGRVFGKDSD